MNHQTPLAQTACYRAKWCDVGLGLPDIYFAVSMAFTTKAMTINSRGKQMMFPNISPHFFVYNVCRWIFFRLSESHVFGTRGKTLVESSLSLVSSSRGGIKGPKLSSWKYVVP